MSGHYTEAEAATIRAYVRASRSRKKLELAARLLAGGALDAMLVPATMKKGRPGHWLVVVCEPTDSERLAALILATSTTLGVRVREDRRIELERSQQTVNTSLGDIELKIARLPDGRLRAFPEFESVRRAAERSGHSLAEVQQAALAAWEGGNAP